MRILLCNCNCNSPPSLSLTPPQKPTPSFLPPAAVWTKKTLITALSGALSLTLLVSSPSPALSSDSPPFQPTRPPQLSTSLPDSCNEEEQQQQLQSKVVLKPEFVTNEEIVQEAWQIVNDSFLDTDRHRWSPQSWEVNFYFLSFCFVAISVFLLLVFNIVYSSQQKKEDILGTSIQTRSKAHELIKRMLASLGDPYTRFLSPAEVILY